MDRVSENKIIIIKQSTRLNELIIRFNTISQAKFYIEHLGADFSDYVNEHNRYNNVVNKAEKLLNSFGRVQTINRTFLPNFVFGKDDIAIAIGRDGLVANTLKYLDNQPLIGINPDPDRWDGILLPFSIDDLKLVIPEVFNNKRKIKEVSMAKATLNDGQYLYAVNDLFIGQKTHVSAHYNIEYLGQKEFHSSSGIIVSTGLGSTGWLKSILVGAQTISKESNNIFTQKKSNTLKKNKKNDNNKIIEKEIIKELNPKNGPKIKWDSNYLFFSVREPFPAKKSQANLVFGKVSNTNPLILVSQMPENGVIFSDGIENDFLSFNSGIKATITTAEKKGHLVI